MRAQDANSSGDEDEQMNVNTDGFGSKSQQAKLKEQRQKEIEALKNLGNEVNENMNVEGSRWANSI